MGKKTAEEKIVRKFLERIKKFNPEKVIFFGSRTRSEALEESDYDFLVVSKKFESIPFLKRSVVIKKLLLGLPASFEVLCYTPEEFERKVKEIGIVKEAVRSGIRLL